MATGDDEPGFITLPPGLVADLGDSATHRISTPRPERAAREEIVFFNTAPGIAPVPVAEEPAAEEPAAEETRVVPRHAAHSWRVRVGSGEPVIVDTALFVGRNPVPTAGFESAAVLPIDDPDKTLSKTHALLEADDGALWVTDLHSTNGVLILLADDSENLLEPGTRTSVPAGSTIEFGSFPVSVEYS